VKSVAKSELKKGREKSGRNLRNPENGAKVRRKI